MVKFFKQSTRSTSNTHPKANTYRKAVKIDAHDHSGNGLSLSQQPIMVVEGAIAGETCDVRITKTSKKVNFAHISKIESPSAKRVAPFCQYFGKCGGCTLQQVNAIDGLSLKENALQSYLAKQMGEAQFAKVDWQTPIKSDIEYTHQSTTGPTSHPFAYRRRIRLAIDARNPKAIKLGFRAKSSKDIIHISTCPVALPQLNHCLALLPQMLKSMPQLKNVGHIVLTQGADLTELAFFMSETMSSKTEKWLTAVSHKLDVNVVAKDKSTNTIRIGPNGEPNTDLLTFSDTHPSLMQIDSDQFLQVNQEVNAQMLAQAKQWLAGDQAKTLYDFFCGAGNFSIYLAEAVVSVQGFEGLKSLVESAKANAQDLAKQNSDFTQMDLSDPKVLATLEIVENSVVVLDPSREGAQALCEHLKDKKVSKIIYVSCNPNSFVRDTKILLGQFELSRIKVLDMFPFTGHLEIMALFLPKSSPDFQ